MRHIPMFSIPKANRVKYWNCLIEFQFWHPNFSIQIYDNINFILLFFNALNDEKSDLIASTLFKNKTCRLHVFEYFESLKI